MKKKFNILIVLLLTHTIVSLANVIQAQSSDTIILRLQPSKDCTAQVQNALSHNTNKWLHIIIDGTFFLNQAVETKKDRTIIEFTPNSKFVFQNSQSSGITIKNNNCIVKNGKIQGNGTSSKSFYQGYGILIHGVDNCLISNMTFEKISGNNILLLQTKKGCNNNQIRNNTIINPVFDLGVNGDEAGILLGYSGYGYSHNNNIIENNFIDGGDVLKIGVGIIGHGKGNVFRGNNIQNLRNYGIISYESEFTDVNLSESIIDNNTIRNIGEVGRSKTPKGMGIYLMKSNNSLVSENKVYNTLRNSDQNETLSPGAISISASPNTIVRNNVVDGSFMYGITSDYSFNSKFINNIISNTRKSGAYFINMNNIIVKGNSFRNIGEVVLKGYFEDTSLQYIKDQMRIDTYKNIRTGNNFIISENSFYTDQNVLFFTGSDPDKSKKYKGNRIARNKFENNRIIGNNKRPLNEKIAFRIEDSGSNIVRNNEFLTN